MSQTLRIIINRQAVLKYKNEPKKSLEYLRKHLGLYFNHQKERLGKKSTLRTFVDQGTINRRGVYFSLSREGSFGEV